MGRVVGNQPVIPVNVDKAHAQPFKDWHDEATVLEYVRPNRWMSLDLCSRQAIRCNWVVFSIASFVMWIITILTLTVRDPEDDTSILIKEFDVWKSWVAQNFDWFYVATQSVWIAFIAWLALSKYGNIRLGKDSDRPEHSNLAYFSMLFSAGIAVGVYYWGVSEPMYYYRGGRLFKPGFLNDDQRAQQAMTVLFFHWGVHAWVCYLVVAILLALVSYRWDMPMTIRSAFYPLIGNVTNGIIGDLLDSLSMVCTTLGVCTSLGFGASSVQWGMYRLDMAINGVSSIPPGSIDWQIGIIWVITICATASVLSGLSKGIKALSMITFAIGCFTLLSLVFLDNTWFLLNNYIQSCGHYIQWLTQLSFETDSWQMLSHEFMPDSGNKLWDSGTDRLLVPVQIARTRRSATPSSTSARTPPGGSSRGPSSTGAGGSRGRPSSGPSSPASRAAAPLRRCARTSSSRRACTRSCGCPSTAASASRWSASASLPST
mmetsp:Transcript_30151/g.71391  ORF Transcript_30151/g.71391 Transcript_30151/m.71391 type:complete len:487 (+) Transcript_30151:79-1539(+)